VKQKGVFCWALRGTSSLFGEYMSVRKRKVREKRMEQLLSWQLVALVLL